MAKEKKNKKGFWQEFREFIARGNVLDLAVGVIIASAFTAIVTALSENILKPIINCILTLILGKDSLSDIYTFLIKKTAEDGTIDLTQSIYIDWGTFINAIINFILIALVLFCIIKIMAKMQAIRLEYKEAAERIREEKAAAKEAELAAEEGEPKDEEAVAEEPAPEQKE